MVAVQLNTAQSVTISMEARDEPHNLHAVMMAISDLASRFSTALEAMATRINKLEGAKPLLPATGHEKPSPSWRDTVYRGTNFDEICE